MHDARDGRVGVEAVDVGEGEDGLGADDHGEVAPELLECHRIDAWLEPCERGQRLIDEGEAVARPHASSGASDDGDGNERADPARVRDSYRPSAHGWATRPLARRRAGDHLNTFTPDFYVGYFRDLSKLAATDEMTPEAILAVMARYATYPAGTPGPDEPEDDTP